MNFSFLRALRAVDITVGYGRENLQCKKFSCTRQMAVEITTLCVRWNRRSDLMLDLMLFLSHVSSDTSVLDSTSSRLKSLTYAQT